MDTTILTTSKPILVTGATGYIASHVIQRLLQQGYKVRGTVRSLGRKEKYAFLYKLVPEKVDNLTLVEAELTDSESWPKACDGVDYILHIASPIPPYVPKDEDEIVKPAIAGTMNVLNSALEKGCKKVVVTSSCLSIFFGNEDKVLTEEDWSDLSKCPAYPKSKVLAEKAAWEFYEKNKDKIDVTVVNPSLIFGPVYTVHGNSSETLMAEHLKGTYPGVLDPETTPCVVDVRDVADAHINALFNRESKGKRYIVANTGLAYSKLASILKDEFEQYGYKINTNKVNAQQVKDSGNPVAQRTLGMIGKAMKVNNERGVKELGLKYINVEDTVKDMAYSLIKAGVVEDKIKK
jgi:nucleoside-diphosphate-sugar epimerase